VILLCGVPSEGPLQSVIAKARALGVPHAVLNQRESQHTQVRFDVWRRSYQGVIRVRETDIPLHTIRGVYTRLMDCGDLPENRYRGRLRAVPEGVARSGLLHAVLLDWLEIASCRVLNRASAMASNMSKPYQAQAIADVGFRVPETVISNDPAVVRRFARRHRRVVYKSTSSARSIVQELTSDRLKDLDLVRQLPTQFQERVPGRDLRVHTVGPSLFATEIDSASVDYRYAAQQGHPAASLRPMRLPADVAQRCVRLSERLGLPLSGIDLKRTPDGQYFCFEVNPSPAFNYYEAHTGQPIAETIVRFLAAGGPA